VVVSGAISSGALPGIVDLAPNYAGILQGINGSVVASFISISPYIVGLITFQQVLHVITKKKRIHILLKKLFKLYKFKQLNVLKIIKFI